VLNKASALLAAQRARLYSLSPLARLQALRLRCRHDREKFITAGRYTIRHYQQRLQHAAQGLNALSPLATLERGYAIVQREDTAVVRAANQVKPGERIHARLRRGSLDCRVEKVNNNDDP
jgi:exodeoxyribonuclease VII large subunit